MNKNHTNLPLNEAMLLDKTKDLKAHTPREERRLGERLKGAGLSIPGSSLTELPVCWHKDWP